MVLQWGGEEIFFQTLVVDSLTDVQEKVVKSYENDDFDITQQSWGRVHRMVSGVLDMLRALPVNLIMTCLCSSELYSDGLRRSPLLYGKRFPAQVGKWFSAVGFVTTAEDNGELAHGVVWRPRKDIVAKPAPGFPAGSRFDLTEKGSGTLGSLLCRSFPNMGVAATEHDHATKAAGPIKE
uniref:Putative ATPase domain containing protein n=1 Tax=viral metagenome TaxID=1070528 RepID=A0A6M3KTW2_9ZZZZ